MIHLQFQQALAASSYFNHLYSFVWNLMCGALILFTILTVLMKWEVARSLRDAGTIKSEQWIGFPLIFKAHKMLFGKSFLRYAAVCAGLCVIVGFLADGAILTRETAANEQAQILVHQVYPSPSYKPPWNSIQPEEIR